MTRKIAKELGLPRGYRLRTVQQGHLEVVRPDGTPLRGPSGIAIKVSGSPSDWRSRLNTRARIRKALRR